MISELKKRSLARGGISPALCFDHVVFLIHPLFHRLATGVKCIPSPQTKGAISNREKDTLEFSQARSRGRRNETDVVTAQIQMQIQNNLSVY